MYASLSPLGQKLASCAYDWAPGRPIRLSAGPGDQQVLTGGHRGWLAEAVSKSFSFPISEMGMAALTPQARGQLS